MISSSGASVTIFADGTAWAAVRDGVAVRLRGTAQPDTFSTLPSVVIRARGAPEILGQAAPWTRWATHARDRLAESAGALDADRGGLLRGLVVGDTRGIDAALTADAKTTGLTHLVAVSGSHMAIVAALVLLMLRRFGPRVSGVGVVAAFGVLVLLVGVQPSVVRAVAMGLIAVVAAVVGRSRSGLSALSGTVFTLLLIDPTLAVSVGFALSVQATAGLILLAPVLTRALRRRGMPRGWALLLAIPIAAHLATVPVITAISGRVSLAAIPANIVVAPVVAPALLLGLACLAAGLVWPPAGAFLARLDGPLLGWVTGTAHRLARWPGATVPWSESAVGVAALAATIIAVLVAFRFRTTRAVLLAATVGVAVVVVAAQVVSVGWPGRGWLLTMCDVGQGDGIVLSTDAPGEAVVVDTGPEPAVMDACLDGLGVTTIALLVITHLHADHVGGLAGAIQGRRVEEIAIGPDRSVPASLREIADAARNLGAPVVAVTPGGRWQTDGLRLDVLGPTRRFVGTDSDPNNDSVVLRATHDGVRMLLAGDIERPAQQALLDSGVDLHADVLKQPHHGSSKLLPRFVDAVGAEVAVIGVGVGNDYGHPSPAALQRDHDAGIATILRTDTDGDVQIVGSDAGLGAIARGPRRASAVR
jgi:competence protein ComEC